MAAGSPRIGVQASGAPCWAWLRWNSHCDVCPHNGRGQPARHPAGDPLKMALCRVRCPLWAECAPAPDHRQGGTPIPGLADVNLLGAGDAALRDRSCAQRSSCEDAHVSYLEVGVCTCTCVCRYTHSVNTYAHGSVYIQMCEHRSMYPHMYICVHICTPVLQCIMCVCVCVSQPQLPLLLVWL